MVGWGWKSYLGLAETAPFSGRNFSRCNKHPNSGMSYRLDISVLFSWAIAISDFCPLEIYKNWWFPFSTKTFTVNSHADNYFYNYICFSIYFFLLKVKVFYIQISFKCETPVLFFLIRTMVCKRKRFIEKKKVFFCWLCRNYWITCCTNMKSHSIWVDESTRVIISIKKLNKNFKILKKKIFEINFTFPITMCIRINTEYW